MRINIKQIYKNHLLSFLIIYPFLPLIKEWQMVLGNLFELYLLLFFITYSLLKFKDGSISIEINSYLIYLIILLIFSLLLNINNFYDSFSSMRIYLLYIGLFISIKKALNVKIINKNDIVNICILVAIIMSIGAIIQFIYPSFIKNLHSDEYLPELLQKTRFTAFNIYNRATSFMNDPNLLSVYLLFNIILAKSFLDKKRYNYCFFILFAGLILTQSRTGIISAIMFLLIESLYKIFTKNKLNIIYVFILFLIILVISINLEFVVDFLRMDTFFSGNGRFDKSIGTFNSLFNQNLFLLLLGNGLSLGRNYIIENSYLFLLYSFGVFGTLIFIISIILLLKKYFHKPITKIALIIYMIVCFLGDYLLIPQITYVFIIIIVLGGNNKEYRNFKKGDQL